MSRTRLDIAVANIEFARKYTTGMLEGLSDGDWYTIPAGGVSNVAWQVGHLAMAQYALTLIRVRGKEPADAEFMSNNFFKRYKKGSSPSADPQENESIDSLRSTFQNVHAQALKELASFTDEELDVKLPEPHAVFDTKLGSVFFCGMHEMLHAGQIGLIRRMLGKVPLR